MQINNISRVGTKRSHWCVFFNIWAENPELNDNGFRWSSKVKIMSYQQNNKLTLYAHNLKHKSKKKKKWNLEKVTFQLKIIMVDSYGCLYARIPALPKNNISESTSERDSIWASL